MKELGFNSQLDAVYILMSLSMEAHDIILKVKWNISGMDFNINIWKVKFFHSKYLYYSSRSSDIRNIKM